MISLQCKLQNCWVFEKISSMCSLFLRLGTLTYKVMDANKRYLRDREQDCDGNTTIGDIDNTLRYSKLSHGNWQQSLNLCRKKFVSTWLSQNYKNFCYKHLESYLRTEVWYTFLNFFLYITV